MSNGPLGGFMPTPPAPSQPPQVSFESTAESRGNFKSFLNSIPSNGALAPIQTGVGSSSPAPVSPIAGNIDIFNTTALGSTMPMQSPKPIQMMFDGGAAYDAGGEFDTGGSFDSGSFDMGGYDEPYSSDDFSSDPFQTTEEQQRNIQAAQAFMDSDSGSQNLLSAPPVDTRPRTNISNVGAGSNLRYDPQFALDSFARSAGVSPQSLLDRGYGAQFGMGQDTSSPVSSGLPPLNIVSNEGVLPKESSLRPMGLTSIGGVLDKNLQGYDLSDVAPVAGSASINPLKFGTSDLLDDPLGLGVRTGYGPAADAARRREALTGAFGPLRGFDQMTSLAFPQASNFGLNLKNNQIGGVEDDLIQAIRGGRSDLYAPFTNNPGNLKQAQEDLTTETIKSVDPVTGDIRTGPAFFSTLPAGQQALDRQLSLYGDRAINTPEKFVETYLGTDTTENPLENQRGYITAVRNAVGDNFDLSDTATRNNIIQAITRQEIGQKGINALANAEKASKILEGFDPSKLSADTTISPGGGITRKFTTTPRYDLDQMMDIERAVGQPTIEDLQKEREFLLADNRDFLNASRMPGTAFDSRSYVPPVGIAPVGEQLPGSRGALDTSGGVSRFGRDLQVSGVPNIRPDLQGDVRQSIQNALGDVSNQNVQKYLESQKNLNTAKDLASRGLSVDVNEITGKPEMASTVDNLLRLGQEAEARKREDRVDELLRAGQLAQDEKTAALSLGIAPFTRQDTQVGGRVRGEGDAVENLLKAGRREELLKAGRIADENIIDDANTFRQNVPDAAKIFGGKQITTTPTGLDSIVGDDERFAELNLGDIQGNVNQERIADILNRPDRFSDTFKVGDVELPNALALLANKAGKYFDQRLFDGIVKKGLSPVVDPDTGLIIGAKDKLGNIIEGRGLDDLRDEGGSDDPIVKFLKKASEEKDEDEGEKLPNVIGGTVDEDAPASRPTVVASPFTTTAKVYDPVGYQGGNLNDLIERITGIKSPKRAQEGGLIRAVDNFLSNVA